MIKRKFDVSAIVASTAFWIASAQAKGWPSGNITIKRPQPADSPKAVADGGPQRDSEGPQTATREVHRLKLHSLFEPSLAKAEAP